MGSTISSEDRAQNSITTSIKSAVFDFYAALLGMPQSEACIRNSEVQLQRKLCNPGIGRSLRKSKCATGADISIHVLELRVVKDVEEFCPELQIQAFRQFRVLQQCHIPIVYT